MNTKQKTVNALFDALMNSAGDVAERYEGACPCMFLAGNAYGTARIYNADFTTLKTTSDYNNPYYFTATRLDILDGGDLKIMYYRARYYDTYTGRFLQRDPLGIDPAQRLQNLFDPQSQYMYCCNIYENALSRVTVSVDPRGLIPIEYPYDFYYPPPPPPPYDPIEEAKKTAKKYIRNTWDKKNNCIKETLVIGHGYPGRQFIGGKEEHSFNPRVHLPNGQYCCTATVWLGGCKVGKDAKAVEEYAKSIGRRNRGKYIWVCACKCDYIEYWLGPWRITGYCEEGNWLCYLRPEK